MTSQEAIFSIPNLRMKQGVKVESGRDRLVRALFMFSEAAAIQPRKCIGAQTVPSGR